MDSRVGSGAAGAGKDAGPGGGTALEQGLRIVTLVVTAVAAIATTSISAVQQHVAQHRQPPGHAVRLTVTSPGAAWTSEANGRVLVWQWERQLAAQAAAQAAANSRSAPPKPAPVAIPSYARGTVQDIIVKAFTPYGATAVAWGLRVARCESGYNPRAYNPAGPYYGVFQFLMSTFRATPYGNGDIYDPVANVNAAAWKYAQGGAGAWGCK